MEAEFLEHIERHQGIIHKVCRMYTRRTTDREDLFQEILLQLWHGYPRYDSDLPFATWMYRVALNTAITYFRRRRRRPIFRMLTAKEESLAEHSPTKEEDLYEAISHLDKIDKAIILLQLDNHSYQEIAEIMQVSPSNVGVRINRIKRKLKHIFHTRIYESG